MASQSFYVAGVVADVVPRLTTTYLRAKTHTGTDIHTHAYVHGEPTLPLSAMLALHLGCLRTSNVTGGDGCARSGLV